jgi:hypothetical protein
MSTLCGRPSVDERLRRESEKECEATFAGKSLAIAVDLQIDGGNAQSPCANKHMGQEVVILGA